MALAAPATRAAAGLVLPAWAAAVRVSTTTCLAMGASTGETPSPPIAPCAATPSATRGPTATTVAATGARGSEEGSSRGATAACTAAGTTTKGPDTATACP